jgi:3-methyladenine DNA glycosylase/8-oxoguanine DNA glycosylase
VCNNAGSNTLRSAPETRSSWKGFRSYATFYIWAALPRRRTDR